MIYNTIIIGSGPSGYTAGIYNSRAGLAPLLISGIEVGGQLTYTTLVENYPGFKEGIMGPQLMMDFRQQAEKFGTKIIDDQVTKVDFSQRPFKVWIGNQLNLGKTIIIATGASAITLNLSKEKELMGRGISTCAVCDAVFYKDKVVYVIGGGDSAMEDTLALSKFAKQINLLVRKNTLRASQIMQDRIKNNNKVNVFYNAELKEILGKNKLSGLIIFNNQSQKSEKVDSDGLFYAIGHRPNTDLFKDKVEIDEKGYILTSINGLKSKINPYNIWLNGYPTMTSVDGIFAAGDVVDFRYRQAITASGFGCMAALDVEKWLGEHN